MPKLCEILLKLEAEINAMDKYGQQPLHLACNKGYAETGCLLLSHGSDVRAVDHTGKTPLHAAAGGDRECPKLCEILLKQETNINAMDKYGQQPLHLACKHVITELSLTYDISATTESSIFISEYYEGEVDFYEGEVDNEDDLALHITSRPGMFAAVQLLLDLGADTNAMNKSGQTPLHVAAGGEKDCPELCEILLRHDAKIDAVDEGGNQPLHLACKQAHVNTGRLLLSQGADFRAVNAKGHCPLFLISDFYKRDVDSEGNLALHITSRCGMSAAVQLLVDLGADTNTMNKSGQTPLHAAVSGEKDCPELCETLLKHGATIDAVDEDGNQPLHLACNRGHINTASLLLSHEADTNTMNKSGQTPLHAATSGEKDCPELCEILLRHDAKIDAKIDAVDEGGNQPLHLACKQAHVNTGSLLLSQGADFRAINAKGHCPLFLISDFYERDVDSEGNLALHITSRCGMFAAVQLLVDLGADTNTMNKSGQTPLHAATSGEKDCPELCEILLRHDAKIDAVDEGGNQPLHLACKQAHVNTGSLLLSQGADFRAVNAKGHCPLFFISDFYERDADSEDDLALHITSRYGMSAAVQLLVDLGADTNAMNKSGQTPLHVAVDGEKDCPKLCEILLKHSTTIDAVDKGGNQPFHLACKRSHTKTGIVLLSHAPNVTSRYRNMERTFATVFTQKLALEATRSITDAANASESLVTCLLYWAVYNGSRKDMQLLLKLGANPNGLAHDHSISLTPLHVAVTRKEDSPELSQLLIECGSDINAVDESGNQALHIASSLGHTETVKLLLAHTNTNIDGVNRLGLTPLLSAVAAKTIHPESCEALLEHNASIDAMDADGNQPLHVACRSHSGVVDILLSYGANSNAANKHGQTPLHTAANNNEDSPRVCEMLLKHDARVNAVDEDGNQAFHLACRRHHTRTAITLLSYGPNVTTTILPDHTRTFTTNFTQSVALQAIKHVQCTASSDKLLLSSLLYWATHSGAEEDVKMLLKQGANANGLANGTSVFLTPLHVASDGKEDSPTLCQLLVKHGSLIDAIDEFGQQPLHLTCYHGYTKAGIMLIHYEADTNALNKHRQTPLHRVAGGERDCPELCEILLKRDAKIDAVDKDGNQPFHLACKQGHTETGIILLNHGPNITCRYQNEERTFAVDFTQTLALKATRAVEGAGGAGQLLLTCLLYWAVYNGKQEDMRLLLKLGANPNGLANDDSICLTPLHVLVSRKEDSPELSQLLIDYGSDTNAVDESGNQALHMASSLGHTETVKCLVAHVTTNVNGVNRLGLTPLLAAVKAKTVHPELCETLLQHNASTYAVDADGNQPLHVACKRDHGETTKVLLSHGASSNATNKYGQTPLHIVAGGKNDHPELCEVLLKHAANVNAVDKDRNQPLHLACKQGHIMTGTLLVFQGADAFAVDTNGDSPLILISWSVSHCKGADSNGNLALHIAASKGMVGAVSLLLDCGADANAPNKHGQTALHTAAGGEKDSPELCEILLKQNTRINAVDKDGNQPLHLACKLDHSKTAHFLVSHGAGTNEPNRQRQTALHIVAGRRTSSQKLCKMLLDCGARLDAADKDGRQPLHIACERENVAVGELLLSSGANVLALDSQETTPCISKLLMAAVENECISACELFLEKGADPNYIREDGLGIQPLIAAVKQSNIELCQLLLGRGATVLDGALHDAIDWNMTDLAKLLLSHGGNIENSCIGKQTVLERSKRTGTRDMSRLLRAARKFLHYKCVGHCNSY